MDYVGNGRQGKQVSTSPISKKKLKCTLFCTKPSPVHLCSWLREILICILFGNKSNTGPFLLKFAKLPGYDIPLMMLKQKLPLLIPLLNHVYIYVFVYVYMSLWFDWGNQMLFYRSSYNCDTLSLSACIKLYFQTW